MKYRVVLTNVLSPERTEHTHELSAPSDDEAVQSAYDLSLFHDMVLTQIFCIEPSGERIVEIPDCIFVQ